MQELDAQHLLTSSGGNITGSIPALGAFRVEVTDRERFDSVLREKPTGDRFTEEAEKRFSLLEVPNDPGYPQQWWAQAIGLPAVWGMPALTVATVVAVIDTGLRADAAELSGRVVSPYSFPAESGEDWAGTAMMESR